LRIDNRESRTACDFFHALPVSTGRQAQTERLTRVRIARMLRCVYCHDQSCHG
jgi:hypothetical protein